MRKSLPVNCIFSLLPVTLLMLAIVSSSAANAQSRKEVAVYLKSGDVVFGKILSYDSLGNYRISNSCGITQFDASTIDYISGPARANQEIKRNGYYNQSTFALLFGEGSAGYQPMVSLTMVNGWQWRQRLFTGFGLGYEHYSRGVLPLFAEAKYFFSPELFSPFISFRIGYAFPVEKQDQSGYYGSVTATYGGILLNPEAGIRVGISNNACFIAGIGYNYQELSYKESYTYWGNYDKTVFTNYNRISVRLGFIFQ